MGAVKYRRIRGESALHGLKALLLGLAEASFSLLVLLAMRFRCRKGGAESTRHRITKRASL